MWKTACIVTLLCIASGGAQALCRDDLKEISPRIARLKTTDLERYWIADKWFIKAMAVERTSETECIAYYEKARKALTQPVEQTKNCVGPNAYQPYCQVTGRVPPIGAAAGNNFAGQGGGGGGGGGARPFTPPPGIVSSPGSTSSSGSGGTSSSGGSSSASSSSAR